MMQIQWQDGARVHVGCGGEPVIVPGEAYICTTCSEAGDARTRRASRRGATRFTKRIMEPDFRSTVVARRVISSQKMPSDRRLGKV